MLVSGVQCALMMSPSLSNLLNIEINQPNMRFYRHARDEATETRMTDRYRFLFPGTLPAVQLLFDFLVDFVEEFPKRMVTRTNHSQLARS
jgi:hypothetical protein